jgi:glycosyltransferase involved in cell wall biosynthesis
VKILYHHRTGGEGAEGIHITSMVQAFRGLGHDVRVFSLMAAGAGAGAGAEKGRWLGRLVKRLPRALYEVAEMGYNLKAYPEIMRTIRSYRPELIYDRYNLYNDCVMAAARATNVPAFLEVNTPYAYQRRMYEQLSYPWLATRMEARTWRLADRILVVSTPLKRVVMEAGIPADRIDVLPNGVDLELFDSRLRAEPANREPGGVRIGFVGSLRRWHGVDLLLEAAEPLLREGRAQVVIVGDGSERGALEEMARERKIGSAVLFAGNVPHDRIPATIATFDIAVSPRSVFYQSPMKILEYMAMKCAVVAPDTENIRDLVIPEREALLFRPDDLASLREALSRLTGDPALRARLGDEARRGVEHRRTWLGNARHVLGRWEEFQARSGDRPFRSPGG